MSSGYKHLYSCVTFVIFMIVINFYKSRLNLNREREAAQRTAASERLKRMALNKPIPVEDDVDYFWNYDYGTDRDTVEEDDGHPMVPRWNRFKQYPDRCLDTDLFLSVVNKDIRYHGAKDGKRKRRDPEEVPNSSMYVFLSVLVILIIAAGVDIAKHLTAAAPKEHVRRLSLQNYQALIREKQKQFRMMKQHYSQPSMSINRSIDDSFVGPVVGQNVTGRSEDLPPMKLTPTRQPPPLLRRQSVPAIMRPAPVSLSVGRNSLCPRPSGRRPSIDSFVDIDHVIAAPLNGGNGSPPEVRRRVRMLHRH